MRIESNEDITPKVWQLREWLSGAKTETTYGLSDYTTRAGTADVLIMVVWMLI